MNLDGRTTEGHTVALHAMIDDLRELLSLASLACFAAGLVATIDALADLVDRDWWGVGFGSLAAAIFTWMSLDFRRRCRKYHPRGGRR